jgi:hypothetical protein
VSEPAHGTAARPSEPPPAPPAARADPGAEELADALESAVLRLQQRAAQAPTAAPGEPLPPSVARPRHKHSMSLIQRWRIRRKQRRGR